MVGSTNRYVCTMFNIKIQTSDLEKAICNNAWDLSQARLLIGYNQSLTYIILYGNNMLS